MVEIGKDLINLRLVTFTKWGGFMEQKVRISLGEPLNLTWEEQIILVPYNCGLMF